MADTSSESNKGGVPGRAALYAKLASFAPEALEALKDLALNSTNPSVKLGALNTILNKCIPDLKGVELTGENGEPIKLSVIAGNGYLPKLVKTVTTPTESLAGEQQEIQGVDMAQTSEKDHNSDNGDSKTSVN